MRTHLLFIVILFFSNLTFAEVRIKDLAQVGGKRDIELVGYGLVIGLNGTGDKSGTRPTVQSLANALMKMGVAVDPFSLNVKNVAAVVVTARVSIFSSQGAQLDAVVSSIGNAESLEGGTLLLTPLRGVDGKTYATVQGKVQTDLPPSGNALRAPKPRITVGSIPAGVILERPVRSQVFEIIDEKPYVSINLHWPDYVTAERIVEEIRLAFNTDCLAENPAKIRTGIPEEFGNDVIGFIARLESLTIEPDEAARVVLNENTGTVISGTQVKIAGVAISHGNLKVRVAGDPNVVLPDSATVTEMVSLLTSVGASPSDIAIIFKSLKKLGALKAELVIM